MRIQPCWTPEAAFFQRFQVAANLPLLFYKDDTDIGADQSFHVTSGVFGNQPPFYIADGDSQVRADSLFRITSIAVHTTVDVYADNIGFGCVDGFNGGALILPKLPLKAGSQQEVYHDIVPGKTSRFKGAD